MSLKKEAIITNGQGSIKYWYYLVKLGPVPIVGNKVIDENSSSVCVCKLDGQAHGG